MKRCCQQRRKVLFNELDILQLFRTELLYNVQAGASFGDEMLEDLQSNFKELQQRLNDIEPSMPLEDGDVFAIMLYTDSKQDLYRDIKTSLTG